MPDANLIKGLLRKFGLVVLGVLDQQDGGLIVLAGNAGSGMWEAFTNSPEGTDGLPHPMDRWSTRIGGEIAAELGSAVVFPFEGPPYPPFLDWAGKSGAAFPSPISMFIHQEYGLWHAYRFALLLQEALPGFPPALKGVSPCLSCETQPCLSACPVDAFTAGKYRVKDCVAYLAADTNSDCREQGCSARKACPEAKEFHYLPAHARFHMNAFLKSRYIIKN